MVGGGLWFRTNENAFVSTKRKLLEECDHWCGLSLQAGVFTQARAGVETNLPFFNRSGPTESIWYYDLSDAKVTKRRPSTLSRFDDCIELLPEREEGERSWAVSRVEIEGRNYDLETVNPNRVVEADAQMPEELISLIEVKGREIDVALAALKKLL